MKNEKSNQDMKQKPMVSVRIKRLASTVLLAGAFLTGTAAQASVPGSVPQRATAVRDALTVKLSERKSRADQQAVVKGLPYAETELAQWGNWTNWGNWNNWTNWDNWSNWHNYWGNTWLNY